MSSASREPPFRAEHLGSLLRPSKLLKKRQAIHQKQDTSDGLRQLEEDSIREIVQIQTDCGFRGISDGEYVRHMFWFAATQSPQSHKPSYPLKTDSTSSAGAPSSPPSTA